MSNEPEEQAGSQDEWLYARLESATEGPGGRGRDQEVISQTERGTSRAAATDRGVALAELLEWTESVLRGRAGIAVVRVGDVSSGERVLTLTCEGSDRSVVLDFDPDNGTLAIHCDGALQQVDPFDEREPEAPKGTVEAALNWVCGA
jgi:hypothetical protein